MYSAIIFFISGLMAVIGLSNVWATISGTLKSRRRELSTLRSVGLSPRALSRILSLEALLFGLMPFLISLPVQVLFVAFFLNASGLPFSAYLVHAPFFKDSCLHCPAAGCYAGNLCLRQQENTKRKYY